MKMKLQVKTNKRNTLKEMPKGVLSVEERKAPDKNGKNANFKTVSKSKQNFP